MESDNGNSNSTVFLHPGEGFHATIKATPKHFIVDEISTFTGEDQTETSKRKADDEKMIPESKRIKTENATSDLGSDVLESADRMNESADDAKDFKSNVEWCKWRLRNILPESFYSSIEALAENAITEVGANHPPVQDAIDLGTFPSKDERVILHRCIRYLFPQLKTVTSPHIGVVSVHICPNYKKFSDVIGHDKAKELLRFILVEYAMNIKEGVSIEGDFSKETRRQLHHLIASCYGKFMEAKTIPIDDGNSHKITVRPRKKKEDRFSQSITAFTLWKKNTESQAAIQQLSSHMQLRPHMFNIAGIKDKRAITTQTCTVCGASPSRLQNRCQSLPSHLRVSNSRPVSRVIHLGELEGNRFQIRLTDVQLVENVETDKEESLLRAVNSAIENIKQSGFVNYFGPQRFGRRFLPRDSAGVTGQYSSDLEAPAIGFAILNGDFEKAVNILLRPTESMTATLTNDVDKAKSHFQSTGDVEGTLELMPDYKIREISVLRSLRRYGTEEKNAYTKALLSLPHNSRLLYVHSYCSWVWNSVATTRLQRYGSKAAPGDLAYSYDDGDEATATKVSRPNRDKSNIFVVTEDDVTSNRVQLKDVVLAVPGYQVRYPPNMEEEYGKYLRDLRSKNGDVSEESIFRVPDLKLNAPGAYRRLIEFPRNLNHKFLPAKSTTRSREKRGSDSLPKSDQFLEQTNESESSSVHEIPILSKVLENSHTDLNHSRIVSQPAEVIPNNDSKSRVKEPSSKNFDVELNFDLPPSCYATTMLQELTKGYLH